MMQKILLPIAAASVLAASPAMAQEQNTQATSVQQSEYGKEARIPFADSVGIRNWRADGDDAVYLEDNRRRWYRAELFTPTFGLPFVNYIGIDAGPTGTLDKFGALFIDGERHQLKSLVRIPDPTRGNQAVDEGAPGETAPNQ